MPAAVRILAASPTSSGRLFSGYGRDIFARRSPASSSGVCSLEVNNPKGLPRNHLVVLEIQRGAQTFARTVRPSTGQMSQVHILLDVGKTPDLANIRLDPKREQELRRQALVDRRSLAFHVHIEKSSLCISRAGPERFLRGKNHNEVPHT